MEVTAVWTACTALAGAAIKPVFDFASGHAQRRADRIKSLEEKYDGLLARFEQKIEDSAAHEVELMAVRQELEDVQEKVGLLQADNDKLRASNTALQNQLEEGFAANQDVVVGLQVELAATQQHVVDLVEQLQEAGHVPRPRPKQPQDPITGKFVPKSTSPLKGKK